MFLGSCRVNDVSRDGEAIWWKGFLLERIDCSDCDYVIDKLFVHQVVDVSLVVNHMRRRDLFLVSGEKDYFSVIYVIFYCGELGESRFPHESVFYQI